jgi:hypothetical protein
LVEGYLLLGCSGIFDYLPRDAKVLAIQKRPSNYRYKCESAGRPDDGI